MRWGDQQRISMSVKFVSVNRNVDTVSSFRFMYRMSEKKLVIRGTVCSFSLCDRRFRRMPVAIGGDPDVPWRVYHPYRRVVYSPR